MDVHPSIGKNDWKGDPKIAQVLCRQLTFTVPKVRNNFWMQNFVENHGIKKANEIAVNGIRQEWVFLFFFV